MAQVLSADPERLKEASEYAERAMTLMEGRFDDKGVVDVTYRAQALIEMARKDYQAAIAVCDKGIAHSRENRGEDTLFVGYLLLTKVAGLLRADPGPEAESLLDECEAIFKRWLGPTHRDIGMVYLHRMMLAFASGDNERGKQVGDAMIDHLKKTPEPTHFLAVACLSVARCLTKIGEHGAAVARLQIGIDHLRAHPEWGQKRMQMMMEHLQAGARKQAGLAGK